MRFEGRPPVTPSQAPLANYFAVTPAFFDAMGMHLIRGRGFTDRDTQGSPLVAVVNQTLVDRYFPHEDPIGKRLEIGFSDPPRWREIVGVVADVKAAGLDQDTPVQVYTAYVQMPSFPSGHRVVDDGAGAHGSGPGARRVLRCTPRFSRWTVRSQSTRSSR